jgi:hypothetical protein
MHPPASLARNPPELTLRDLHVTAPRFPGLRGAVQWQGKVPSEPGPLIKRLAQWSGIIELTGIEACPLSEWPHLSWRRQSRISWPRH